MRPLLLIPLVLIGLLAGPARAEKIAGVDYPPTYSVAGQPLQLNGAGIRYRFVVKVYTAGLYLAAPARSPEEALA